MDCLLLHPRRAHGGVSWTKSLHNSVVFPLLGEFESLEDDEVSKAQAFSFPFVWTAFFLVLGIFHCVFGMLVQVAKGFLVEKEAL